MFVYVCRTAVNTLRSMRLTRTLAVGGVAAVLAAAGTIGAYAAESPSPSPNAPLISGGREVSSAPWAAKIPGCSGTIIAPRWVLSAWHCVEGDDPDEPISVLVGDVHRDRGQRAGVKARHHKHDVLLLELDRDIETTYATIADAEPPAGATADIFGWGRTCEKGCGSSDILKTARMRVKNEKEQHPDGARMVLLEQSGDGFALGGDSGGPAMLNGVQFGVLCCGTTSSDGSGHEAYSSLPNVKEWIEDVSGVTPGGPGGGGGNGDVTNLALNRPTKAAQSCNATETSAKAVNGSVSGGPSDKWCSGVPGTKTIEVDLGRETTVRQVVVKHAGAGGEPSSWNTANFSIEISTADDEWQTVATVTGNTDSVTRHELSGKARSIRLITEDQVARIYELEVY